MTVQAGDKHAMCIHQLEQPPDKIERVEQDDGTVRWKGLMLLAPGIWQDGASGERLFYSPEGIKASADRWKRNKLNFLHAAGDETWHVGEVDTETVHTDDEGRLFADIVLDMDSNASKLADEAMTKSFETGGDKGVQGPSVEIKGDKYPYNDRHGVRELALGTFLGAALVGVGMTPGPASKTATFRQQAQERAIAMSEGQERVRLLTLMKHMPPSNGVDPDELPDGALKLASRFLQTDGLTKEDVASAVADTFDLEMDDVMGVLDELQAQIDDEEEEEELQEPDKDPDEEEEEDEDPEEEEEEEEEAEMSLQDLSDQLSEFQSNVDERLSDLEEAHEEHKLNELEERLSNIEDQPQPTRSLHDGGDEDPDDVDLVNVRYLRSNNPDRTTTVNPVRP